MSGSLFLLCTWLIASPRSQAPLPTSNPPTQVLQALCCWREFLAEPNAPLPPTYDELLAMDMRPYPPPGGCLEGGSFEEIEVGSATGRRLKAASQACPSPKACRLPPPAKAVHGWRSGYTQKC